MSKTDTEYNDVLSRIEAATQNLDFYNHLCAISSLETLANIMFEKTILHIKSIDNDRAMIEKCAEQFAALYMLAIASCVYVNFHENKYADVVDNTFEKMFELEKISTYELMQKKNHDYGEAWRDMRIMSFTDLILQKLLRIRQILENDGTTLISEPPIAGFQDIANYSIFAIIKLREKLVV